MPLVLAIALSIGCSAPRVELGVTLSRCSKPGYPVDAQCTSVQVAENPSDPNGRQISLNTVVLPASGRVESDPVFILVGGPGQAATDVIEVISKVFAGINATRDLVFVDQRGTGESSPLDCEMGDDDERVEPLSTEERLDKLRQCLDGLEADPRFYTTPIAMDDLDAVRQALADERINLIGSSYGTRAALVYMRRYPDRVRSVVLDGVAPLSLRLPESIAQDSQRAFDLLVQACESEPECRSSYPEFKQHLAELLERHRTPRRIRVADGSTGKRREYSVSRDQIAGWVFGSLYGANFTSLLPLAIEHAHAGDWGPFAALQANAAEAADGLFYGMHLSVVCAEDLPFIESNQDANAATFLGAAPVRELSRDCEVWPRGEVAAGYRDAVHSDIPTLVLSGELDPVTPPRWGADAAKTLSRSKHVVLAGVGHGVQAVPCGWRMIEDFIENPDLAALDVSCAADSVRPRVFASTVGAVALSAPDAASEEGSQ